MTKNIRRLPTVLAVLVAITLTGCSNEALAEDYLNGGNENFIAGDGAITEIPEAEREDPITFSGTTETGETVAREDYTGQVLVVNFWYAACSPCRAEAPDLQALSEKYDGNGAAFLGVNVYDEAETSAAFGRKFGITYPSVLDGEGQVRLGFAGDISPSAVPITFVLDEEGRIAARIVGQLEARSILDTLISDTIAEGS